MPDLALLKADLVRDEGHRRKPYICTAGKVSIGIGHNLDDLGISDRIIDLLYEEDERLALSDLDRHAPWWRGMQEPARRALANMSFNLGWPKLSEFKRMLAALQAGDYELAATEALDSRWANQVGDRADRIADLYRSATAAA